MNKITINAQIGDKSCLHTSLKCCKRNYGISATWVGKSTIVFNNINNRCDFKEQVLSWVEDHKDTCQLENIVIDYD